MSSTLVPEAAQQPVTRRAQDKAERRQKIIDAATTLFARHGFVAVSLDDIGALAGITGQGIYRHFDSKQHLLTAILLNVTERLHAGGVERQKRLRNPRRLAEELVEFQTEFAVGSPEVIRIQSRELAHVSAEDRNTIRRLQREYLAIWAHTISLIHPGHGQRHNNIRAQAVVGLINSTANSLRKVSPEITGTDDDPTPLVTTMALAAINTAIKSD